ncbi:hypothetical protein AGMMS49949_02140 [Alphaproteobacteria bacterium]|nr:hypothetical protein AGMMS49949_02140 [Alphaproteobacteria bacterium]GHS96123.1 hypothetical protein AGMMS50296_1960 [Alphaproteobacteria bacterium]
MLQLIESSSVLAVSLKRVKEYLRIDHDEEDDFLQELIQTATALVEQDLGRSLLNKVWKKKISGACLRSGALNIALPFPPLLKVIAVNALDKGGKTKPVLRYIIELEHAIPEITLSTNAHAVEVIYQAGYGERASDVPANLSLAVLLVVANLYEDREGEGGGPLAPKIQAILKPYRIERLI